MLPASRNSRLRNAPQKAANRVSQLRGEGVTQAHLYGADETVLGGLNAFYLLVDKPEVYGLPSRPKLPSRSVLRSSFWGVFAALMTALGALFAFRDRTKTSPRDAVEAG